MSEASDDLKGVLDAEGRVTRWPSQRTRQFAVLDYLATKFEPGKIYTEREVNALLDQWALFGDAALLRRELFERGQLNRQKDGSEYWVTPGTMLY